MRPPQFAGEDSSGDDIRVPADLSFNEAPAVRGGRLRVGCTALWRLTCRCVRVVLRVTEPTAYQTPLG